MTKRSTALIGAAGEHYVAFRLSALGFPVALTRGGSPTVDLMVGDLEGQAALSFQVKTSSGAWRSFKRSNEKDISGVLVRVIGHPHVSHIASY